MNLFRMAFRSSPWPRAQSTFEILFDLAVAFGTYAGGIVLVQQERRYPVFTKQFQESLCLGGHLISHGMSCIAIVAHDKYKVLSELLAHVVDQF